MSDTNLLRISALAAMAGGLLRIAGTFAAQLGAHDAQLIYFATDVLLVAGLLGIYLSRRGVLGAMGFAGFAVALFGILMIRSAELFGGYAMGAAITITGFVVLGIAMLLARMEKTAPILWIASLVLGIAGSALKLDVPAALAGVAFGAGFALAGWTLYRRA